VRRASTSRTVRVGSAAGGTGVPRIFQPMPSRPWGRRPARYGMTIGTSSASASRNSSASRAVFRDRAEVAATSWDTRASRCSSMQPWCNGGAGSAPARRTPARRGLRAVDQGSGLTASGPRRRPHGRMATPLRMATVRALRGCGPRLRAVVSRFRAHGRAAGSVPPPARPRGDSTPHSAWLRLGPEPAPEPAIAPAPVKQARPGAPGYARTAASRSVKSSSPLIVAPAR
jgi:hypothetical protein